MMTTASKRSGWSIALGGASVWLLLLLLALVCGTHALTTCTDLSDRFPGIASPSAIRDCFSAIAFNHTKASSTISTLKQQLELYSFLEANKGYGPPFNLQQDTIAQLNYLVSDNITYTSDWQFHKDVYAAFLRLGDGHTGYSLPKGYSSCIAIQPLSITVSQPSSSSAKLKVTAKGALTPSIDQAYYNLFGERLSRFEGDEIVGIEGQDPVQWLKGLAQRIPLSKDTSINFNAVVSGNFGVPRFNFYDPGTLPDSDELILKLKNAGQVKIKYIVKCDASIASSSETVEAANVDVPTRTCSDTTRRGGQSGADTPVVTYHTQLRQRIHEAVDYDADAADAVNEEAPWTLSWQSDDILVLRVSTFEWDEMKIVSDLQWIAEQITKAYAEKPNSKLVVNIQQNPGGIMCIGQFLAQMLRRDFYIPDYSVMRKSDNWATYLNKSEFGQAKFTDANDVEHEVNAIYNERAIPRKWGPVANYTQKFSVCGVCEGSECPLLGVLNDTFYPQDQIVVVSDGVAISTAAFFVKLLDGTCIKTATVGGVPNEPMGLAFSVGGPVFVSLDAMFELLGCADGKPVTPPFPVFEYFSSDIRFSYGAAIEPVWASELGEFYRNEPDMRLPVWPTEIGQSDIYSSLKTALAKGQDKQSTDDTVDKKTAIIVGIVLGVSVAVLLLVVVALVIAILIQYRRAHIHRYATVAGYD
eukprot:TRINITY_DN1056_c0_g2_i1.p1 TRINITY_DN1056_c0_g2~~TRINITY_DN1056_c0_g2_i1.p1  ORF type:complete len:697 (+),score=152.05 TRINITY_DN1056_c0_g2_i1:189-2279(+)